MSFIDFWPVTEKKRNNKIMVKNSNKQISNEKYKLKQKINELISKNNELKNKILELENKISNPLITPPNELLNLKEELANTRTKISELETQLRLAVTARQLSETRALTAETSSRGFESQLAESRNNLTLLQRNIIELETNLLNTQTRVSTTEDSLNLIKNQVASLENEKNQLGNDLLIKNQEFQQIKTQKDQLANIIETLKSTTSTSSQQAATEISKLNVLINEKQQEIKEIKTAKTNFEKQVNIVSQELNQLKILFQQKDSLLKQTELKNTQQAARIIELEKELNNEKDKINNLEAQLEAFNQAVSSSASLKSRMQKAETEKVVAETKLISLNTELDNLKNKNANLEAEKQQAGQDNINLNNEKLMLKNKLDISENKYRRIFDILKTGSNKLDDLSIILNNKNEKLETLIQSGGEILNQTQEISKFESNLVKIEKLIQANATKIDKLEAYINTLKQNITPPAAVESPVIITPPAQAPGTLNDPYDQIVIDMYNIYDKLKKFIQVPRNINSLVKMLCNKNFVGTGVTTGNQRTSCFSTGESTNHLNKSNFMDQNFRNNIFKTTVNQPLPENKKFTDDEIIKLFEFVELWDEITYPTLSTRTNKDKFTNQKFIKFYNAIKFYKERASGKNELKEQIKQGLTKISIALKEKLNLQGGGYHINKLQQDYLFDF
jgi:chromosome segregation ATPase